MQTQRRNQKKDSAGDGDGDVLIVALAPPAAALLSVSLHRQLSYLPYTFLSAHTHASGSCSVCQKFMVPYRRAWLTCERRTLSVPQKRESCTIYLQGIRVGKEYQ